MSAVPNQADSLNQALANAARHLASDPVLTRIQVAEIVRVVGEQPEALLLFGQAQSRLGEHESATRALRRVVELRPQAPVAWLALADHLGANGDEPGSQRAYGEYLRCSSQDPRLLEAGDALCTGRLPEAEALLRERLRQVPTDVAAMRMLAEVAIRLARHDDAIALLERALELAPGFREARQNLALVLQRDNQPQAALAQLELLLPRDPRNPSLLVLKAAAMCRVGEYDGANEIYRELLGRLGNSSRIWLSHGHALKTSGHQEEAIAAYRRSAELDPDFGEAWWSLANLKTFRFSEADLEFMRSRLQREGLADEHRLHFEFALGKALEDAKQYEASFAHYARGNALRLAHTPYRADENSTRLRRARETYTREFFAERQGWGAPDADPIFIVGLPRAGSTLVEQILSSHSAVEGTMELPEVIALSRMLRRSAGAQHEGYYHGVLAGLGRDEVRALGEQYLQRTRVHRRAGAPFFIDKMPNNFAHLGLIQLALPNARIIDARRDPMACCFSAFKQHFAQGQNYTYSLSDLGRYYTDYVELMAHFDEVLPGRVHRVQYEAMVADTEGETRRLLDYCGLPFEEACLRFFENERPVRTASSEQVRQPIYRDGLEQWRHYEPWLGPLAAALGQVPDRAAARHEQGVSSPQGTAT
jgi:tetratricopeptide (TPR) repeat protein